MASSLLYDRAILALLHQYKYCILQHFSNELPVNRNGERLKAFQVEGFAGLNEKTVRRELGNKRPGNKAQLSEAERARMWYCKVLSQLCFGVTALDFWDFSQ